MTRLETALGANDVAEMDSSRRGEPRVMVHRQDMGCACTVFFHRLTYTAEMVDPKELIGAAEVQAILRLSHPSSVTTYLRRYAHFPQPVVDLSASRV